MFFFFFFFRSMFTYFVLRHLTTSAQEFERLAGGLSRGTYAFVVLDAWTWAAKGWVPKVRSPPSTGTLRRALLRLLFCGKSHSTLVLVLSTPFRPSFFSLALSLSFLFQPPLPPPLPPPSVFIFSLSAFYMFHFLLHT
jgi:hypothetical protein